MTDPDFHAIAAAAGGTYTPPDPEKSQWGTITISPYWFCLVRHTNPRGYGSPATHIRATAPHGSTLTRAASATGANISSNKTPAAIGREIRRRVLNPIREDMRAYAEKRLKDAAAQQHKRAILEEMGEAIGHPLTQRCHSDAYYAPGLKMERYDMPEESSYRDEYTVTISVKSLAALKMILSIVKEDHRLRPVVTGE